MNLGVSLADYNNPMSDAFFGNSENVTTEDLAELSKALNAEGITGRETANLTNASGAPLKVESLENTLKIITFKESDIVLWKMIDKLPAYNTVEEYNQLTSYGSESGSFTNEGELPSEEDSTYVRRAEIVKFMGVTRSVSHPMQLVRTNIGPIIDRETKNGTINLLKKANKALAFGDASVVSQEWNGFYSLHRNSFSDFDTYMNSEHVIDLRNKAISEANMEQAALTIVSNYGDPNMFIAPPTVLSSFVKRFYDSKLIQPNTQALQNGIMGQRVKTFQSQYGEVDLNYDKFLGGGVNGGVPRVINAPATSNQAPGNPIPDGVTPTAIVSDSSSKLNSSAEQGDYLYGVASINRFGESSLVQLDTAVTISANLRSVDLKFSLAGSAHTGFVIYRSQKGDTGSGAKLYPVMVVSTGQRTVGYDGGAAGIVRDRFRYMANTSQSFLCENSNEVFAFKQLAPMMKMDLATLAPSTRWMILLYGTPQMYAPLKFVRFINIGTDIS